jgi:flagellar motor protein MotB
MRSPIGLGILCVSVCALTAASQDTDSKSGVSPIYRVTVVERTTRAINYQYRSGPTPIDFKGTVLLPKAKGAAIVESKQGRTEIDAHFDHLTEPAAFGHGYLTYVLWALTPDGRPHNIGELIANSGNHASLRVTTDLQAFAMIVTAEPYSAVRQPSDVVVLENQVRDDTTGIIEQVNARYELLPRGHYNWEVPDALEAAAAAAGTPKVSMREYEEMLEIYEAQNAVGIARAAGADKYAHDTLIKADTLLSEARQRYARKADRTLAIQEAREATETAEDARAIADRQQQQEQLAKAQTAVNEAQQARQRADDAAEQARSAAQQAQAQTQATEAQLEAERTARQGAEQEATAARQRAEQYRSTLEEDRARASAASEAQRRQQEEAARKSGDRVRMLEQLNGIAPTRDTPRGLVVTIPDSGFNEAALRGSFEARIARIGQTLAARPGLKVDVEGNSDSEAGEARALRRARAVGEALIQNGLTPLYVSVRGLGDTRPLAANSSASGRMENRRVEIVISGEPIGMRPIWDRAYPLASQR